MHAQTEQSRDRHPRHCSSWILRAPHPGREGDRQAAQHNRAERPSMGGTRQMEGGTENPQVRGRTELQSQTEAKLKK